MGGGRAWQESAVPGSGGARAAVPWGEAPGTQGTDSPPLWGPGESVSATCQHIT